MTTVVSWQEPIIGNPPGCLPKRVHLPVLSREECVKGLINNKGFTPEKSCIGAFGSGAVVCPVIKLFILLKFRIFLLYFVSQWRGCYFFGATTDGVGVALIAAPSIVTVPDNSDSNNRKQLY